MSNTFWKKFPTVPGFDSLKMKQEIQARIYEEIKDMKADEIVAYFNRAGEEARQGTRAPETLTVHEETAPYKAKTRRKK